MEKLPETRVLIPEKEIREIVLRLGKEITQSYRGIDRELMVVGLLRGSFVFMADLIRVIDVPLVVDFMCVSSYGNATVSSGDIKIVMDLNSSVESRDILLVEDIVDTGRTFNKVVTMLKNRNPHSIKTCSFLRKPEAHEKDISLDFCGKDIKDEFIVGYGLDYAQRYRELPYIGVLESV